MSYSEAEAEAKRAVRAARNANGQSNDPAINELAVAMAHLAKAVGEIASELNKDQR